MPSFNLLEKRPIQIWAGRCLLKLWQWYLPQGQHPGWKWVIGGSRSCGSDQLHNCICRRRSQGCKAGIRCCWIRRNLAWSCGPTNSKCVENVVNFIINESGNRVTFLQILYFGHLEHKSADAINFTVHWNNPWYTITNPNILFYKYNLWDRAPFSKQRPRQHMQCALLEMY